MGGLARERHARPVLFLFLACVIMLLDTTL